MLFAGRSMVGADRGISHQQAVRAAAVEYERYRQRGVGRRFLRRLGGRGVWLATPEGGHERGYLPVRDRIGTACTIPIADIFGSATPNREYDAGFHPIVDRVRERWIALAARLLLGYELPPVVLSRIGDAAYIECGFEVVSVALALGQEEVDGIVRTGG